MFGAAWSCIGMRSEIVEVMWGFNLSVIAAGHRATWRAARSNAFSGSGGTLAVGKRFTLLDPRSSSSTGRYIIRNQVEARTRRSRARRSG
jgi:hypothetical protein